MNKSPLNYLIAIALGGLLWAITAVLYGPSFSESLTLATMAPEDFLIKFQIFLAIAAGIGIMNCIYWFFYGNRDKVSGELKKAKGVWWGSLIFQIVAASVILIIAIVSLMKEGISSTDYIIIFGLISLHTFIYFWFSTFLMSPKPVKYIPLFK